MKKKINLNSNLKKILLYSSVPAVFLFTTSCSNKNEMINLNFNLMNNKKDVVGIFDKWENEFIDNIEKYANDDSVLFYNVSFIAVAHRYVPISHLLRVLQINPNKEIYFFWNSLYFNTDIEILKQNENMFPNLHLIKYESATEHIYTMDFEYGYEVIDEYKKAIMNNKLDVSKIVLISDEYYFLLRLLGYVNNIKVSQDNFISDYLIFYKFREINMIADGTDSAKFFGNDYFNYFLNNQIFFKFNEETKRYEDAIKFMKFFSNLSYDAQVKFIKENQKLDVTKIYSYLFLASINSIDSTFTQVNFYLPSTKMIEDVNNLTSTVLSDNDKYGLFFNSYNSKNLNFISLLSGLDLNKRNLFFKIIKISDETISALDKYIELFNNSFNVVFSGSKISNNSTNLVNQANILISIYHENYINKDNLKIWYKAHPREVENYETLLKNEIRNLGYPEVVDHIFFLNKTIPMEIFISLDFMKEDKNFNRKVKFYSSFSTICLYMYANKQEDNIKRIIVTEIEKKEIIKRFGEFKDSKIFNSDITITQNDFDVLYSFLTTISHNKNYLIISEYNEKGLIKWNSFSNYQHWPNFVYFNFKISIHIDDNIYEFEKTRNIDEFDFGIEILNLDNIKKIIENSELKEYTLDNYIIDKDAVSILDFNINLLKENRFYTKGYVEIYYKNDNNWSLFSNTNSFIIFVDK